MIPIIESIERIGSDFEVNLVSVDGSYRMMVIIMNRIVHSYLIQENKIVALILCNSKILRVGDEYKSG